MKRKRLIVSGNSNRKFDQLIILTKDNIPYHAAIFLENFGIFDLSLLGSKVTKIITEYTHHQLGLDLIMPIRIPKIFYQNPGL